MTTRRVIVIHGSKVKKSSMRNTKLKKQFRIVLFWLCFSVTPIMQTGAFANPCEGLFVASSEKARVLQAERQIREGQIDLGDPLQLQEVLGRLDYVSPSINDLLWAIPLREAELPYEALESITTLAVRRSDTEIGTAGSWIGYGWLKLESALLLDHRVFIKTSKAFVNSDQSKFRDLGDIRKEVYWTRYLGQRGWGPWFYGVLLSGEHPAIVTDFIEGVHIFKGTSVGDFYPVSQNVIDKLVEFRKFVVLNRIRVKNLQVRITDGKELWIVDPEKYSFATSPREMWTSVKEIDLVLEKLGLL